MKRLTTAVNCFAVVLICQNLLCCANEQITDISLPRNDQDQKLLNNPLSAKVLRILVVHVIQTNIES